MTDEKIAEQIFAACNKSLDRFHDGLDAQPDDEKDATKLVVAEFLSGANQVASFLVRMDGGVTPQQVERAIKLVADDLGLTLSMP